jgi:hypothetical protein
VAHRRHNNGVERNRSAISYGILIQLAPLEKRFRGDVGGGLALLGGRKGPEREGGRPEPEPAQWEGSDRPGTVFERRAHQGLGATADRPWDRDANTGGTPEGNWGRHGGPLSSGGRARMKTNRPSPHRGHVWPARRGTAQGLSGQDAGAGTLAMGWDLDASDRAGVGAEGDAGRDSRPHRTGPCGNPPAARVAESAG